MNKFEFSFQNLADIWTKDQVKTFRMKAKHLYKKGGVWSTRMIRKDWKQEYENVEHFYHANKALFFGASKELPFTTLTLLGELLGHEYFKDEVKKIIDENILKYEGQFFKLDDPENQIKVRRALRSYKFHSTDKKAA